MKRLGFGLILLGLLLAACGFNPSRVVVEWTTATEMNTAGFNLYRSENAEGPYVQINPHIIPASTDPLVGGKYKFEDSTVTPGKTYYYQLEDVEFSGTSTKHPSIAVTADASSGTIVVVLLLVGIIAVAGAGVWFWRRR